MNVCDLNKFINMANNMDNYRFDPVNEEVTISKGSDSVVIDLTLSTNDQLSLFQLFLDGLNNGN